MSKEMIISVNGREKKIAIVDNGQVTEFYIERGEDNSGVVGNIYKGRVMRVLPGMQSAIVDIGLERDAFLYVSDFFDEEEEIERIVMEKSEKSSPEEAEREATDHVYKERLKLEKQMEEVQDIAEPLAEIEPVFEPLLDEEEDEDEEEKFPKGKRKKSRRGRKSKDSKDKEDRKRRAGYWGELFIMMVGALFLAFNLAPTEEMVLIAYMMSDWHILGLILFTLIVMHAFVYALEFKGQASIPEGTPFWSVFLRFTVVGYTIALLISLFILWMFGRLDGQSLNQILTAVIVLGFPAAIGAAAARLIL